MNYITEVKELKRSVIPISLEDLASSPQSALVNNIVTNTVRYVELFEDVIDSILPSINRFEEPVTATDILNVLLVSFLKNRNIVKKLLKHKRELLNNPIHHYV